MSRKGNDRKIWDVFIAAFAAVLTAPLMAVIAVWIKLDSPGPVFFRQKRVGIHKTYFDILKFRTMRTDTPADVPTHLLKDPEQYITRSGRFLRKSSLDELPQIFNILRGEMSIVGPRPALWNQEDLIAARDRYGANDVLPGLTGWAQIHGRDTLSIQEKANLDGYYVRHQGFWMDLRCILLTVRSVLKQDGVQEGGTGTAQPGGSRESGSTAAASPDSSGEPRCAAAAPGSGCDPCCAAASPDSCGEPSVSSADCEPCCAAAPGSNCECEPSASGSCEGEECTSCMPLVSVIVATYRREQELRRALASLAAQTYPNLEVILVDDNADALWNRKVSRIVERWRQVSRIPLTYIRNSANRGSAASRNIGLRAASGVYLTFLDDDDKYLPGKTEHQVLHMEGFQSDFSVTDLALYRENGSLQEKRTRYYLKKIKAKTRQRTPDGGTEYLFLESAANDLLACHLMYHLTGTDTLMFRRDYLQTIGGFPPTDVGDEFYLMREALAGGGTFSYLPQCEVKALIHERTEGISSRERKVAGENALYEYKKQYFSELTSAQVREIRMRHYLVLAYAYLRNRQYGAFVQNGILAAGSAPIACAALILRRKG